jgi:hypothetical protein
MATPISQFTDVAAWGATLILLLLLVLPILRYLRAGWAIKREDIMNGFDIGAQKAYLTKFLKESDSLGDKKVEERFEFLYLDRYGRQYFIAPIFALLVIAFVDASLVSETALSKIGDVWQPVAPLSSIAVAAIAGAYMWVVSDFISRSRRLDLSPSDVLWATLRLAIAVPLGYSFASLFKDDSGPFISFALGAFPLETLTTALRRIANKKLGLDIGPSEATNQLIKLEGVDASIVDRLALQDLTTIAQLAYCDPIQVTMRSNLSFNFVVDIVGQALAWSYFTSDELAKLRRLGLRGAYEIHALMEDLKETPPPWFPDCFEAAKSVLSNAARDLNIDVVALKYTFGQIAYDPYTEFLYEVWD